MFENKKRSNKNLVQKDKKKEQSKGAIVVHESDLKAKPVVKAVEASTSNSGENVNRSNV
jgi:hypothetical protein